MTDRVGQQLGNYRLMRLLGQGGFAEVYLGQHQRFNMQAAIKVLHTHLSQADVANFQREAETIAALVHPNIVRILDFDVKEGTPFLVMDYAPNGTLRQRHPKGVPLPLPTVVSYVKQVADALQYAHGQRHIHRDIKPENMLLGRRNEIVLSDFGIATIAHSTTSMSVQMAVGTIPYMAPEQISAHPRAASDQYSLGVVVYEWLSGERPFQGSFTEMVAKHMAVPPPPLREKMPAISPEVEQVVLTALAKDPKQRFSSVQAFAHALEQASFSKQARSSTPIEPTVIPVQPPQPLMKPPLMIQTSPQRGIFVPLDPLARMKEVNTSPSQSTPISEPIIPPPERVQPSTPLPPTVRARPQGSPPAVERRPEAVPQKISRRTVVVGLGLAGVAVVGGGIAWYASHSVAEGTLLYTYRGHSNNVNAMGWSPDGRRIASASADRTVQVWDAADGGNVYTYRGHSSNVNAVGWSPDGRRIASGSDDRTVQVWDAADGGHVYTYGGHSSYVFAVGWSPDGKRIASGSHDETMQVWDAADGGNAYTYRGYSNAVSAVAWSPDGKHIASASYDGRVQVWDAADGGHVYTYGGHSGSVNVVVWSPNGKRIASADYAGTVQVWDAADGGNAYTYCGHSNWVNAVAWSPDGKRIASASHDRTVQVWDATDGGNVYTYRGHSSNVNAVGWSPDGKRIASGSRDKTVQVWIA